MGILEASIGAHGGFGIGCGDGHGGCGIGWGYGIMGWDGFARCHLLATAAAGGRGSVGAGGTARKIG